MRIKLTTNSVEAKNYISDLKNLDCGYAYTYGVKEGEELNTENSWGIKLFEQIEKLVFKKHKLPQEEKKFINSIANSVELLNKSFQRKDNDYIKDMHISMNVDSSFNQLVKKSLSFIYDLNSSYAVKLDVGTNSQLANASPDTKKIVIGSTLFSENLPEGRFPFMHELTKRLGAEKAIQFTILHEASHTFQKTNLNKYGAIKDERISDLFLTSLELQLPSQRFPSICKGADLNCEIIKEQKDFPQINMNLMNEIIILFGEMYADTGAILLERNSDIEKGSYKKENTLETINELIQSRNKEQTLSTQHLFSKEAVSKFNHFTSPALESLKEQIASLPEKVLSQEEMYAYCDEFSKRGLARIILSSCLANPDNEATIKLLYSLKKEGENFSLPEKIDTEATTVGFNNLKSLAGEEWFNRFAINLEHIKKLDVVDKVDLIFQAGVNQEELEKNLVNINPLNREPNVLSSSKNEQFTPKEKNQILESISEFRNAQEAQSSIKKNKI